LDEAAPDYLSRVLGPGQDSPEMTGTLRQGLEAK
jgi:hypothetical protein